MFIGASRYHYLARNEKHETPYSVKDFLMTCLLKSSDLIFALYIMALETKKNEGVKNKHYHTVESQLHMKN